ncbi:MAG: DUF3467 domain-containing protein [Planctomycetota bacterium]
MADTETAAQTQQQIQVRVDTSKMQTSYANTIRSSTTADELVLDFGINIPQQGPEGQPVMVFDVHSRTVMSWPSAKRLLGSLHQAVSAYEARFGEIDLNPKQPIQQG